MSTPLTDAFEQAHEGEDSEPDAIASFGIFARRLEESHARLLEALSELVTHLEGGAYAGEVLPKTHPMHAAHSAILAAQQITVE